EDPQREGLLKTPQRFAKAIRFLTSGYAMDAKKTIESALFNVDCEEMVIVKDIEFYSLCEHHLLPVSGKVHIGYLPQGKVIGLSKMARVVDIFARRLQVQERMTNQIALALMESLNARGIGVIVEAIHYCMIMRGVQKQESKTVTSAMFGSFRDDNSTRSEFMNLALRQA
ncbi:MAG: GTP cyclohydrolase I FolE, partial [Candidatus Oxydemutatoraceae bacterium WSBS_2016_MAG_OTU14]